MSTDDSSAAGRDSGLSDLLGACRPVRGLTYRKGPRIANVHDVRGDSVYWGTYTDGRQEPDGLYRCSVDDWQRLAEKAAANGATVFTLVRA